MPNPRCTSACDCTCVLTRIDHYLETLSCLTCAFCFVPAYRVCKVRSRISDALSQALCNLSLAFLADFIAANFSCKFTLCFSFGSKDMITAFTCLPSYRHSSFTLWAYLCWRHIYCQWPIIKLAVSPPLATWSRFIRGALSSPNSMW